MPLRFRILSCIAAVAAVLMLAVSVIDAMDDGSRAETVAQIELAVKQACATCYAIEGRYPPSLEYMRENYGIAVNGSRYRVLYQAFGQNIMPNVKIMEVD